ncbi:hypothetical protein [Amycolatopsis sp. cmx-11-12]|uniref:hypothetical protein n=1 Tax=Amycolatopsis sp. cmx-11-12 TaxID=2785795 RepID=UPI003917D0BB
MALLEIPVPILAALAGALVAAVVAVWLYRRKRSDDHGWELNRDRHSQAHVALDAADRFFAAIQGRARTALALAELGVLPLADDLGLLMRTATEDSPARITLQRLLAHIATIEGRPLLPEGASCEEVADAARVQDREATAAMALITVARKQVTDLWGPSAPPR